MKKIVCSACGGTNIIKQGDVFCCQGCGILYQEEDIKKMLQEEESNVEKTRNIESEYQSDISFVLAKRASNEGKHEVAVRYYEQLNSKYPSFWEPGFMMSYHKVLISKITDMTISINEFEENTKKAIGLLEKNFSNNEERNSILEAIIEKCSFVSKNCFIEIMKWYESLTTDIDSPITTEMLKLVESINQFVLNVADAIDEKYGYALENIHEKCKGLWHIGIEQYEKIIKYASNRNEYQEKVDEYKAKIGTNKDIFIPTESNKTQKPINTIQSKYESDILLEEARKAEKDAKYDIASKYYEQLAVKYPKHWEPVFMTAYYRAMLCKIADKGTRIEQLENAVYKAFSLVDNYLEDEKSIEAAVGLISVYSYLAADACFNIVMEWYEEIESSVRSKFTNDMINGSFPSIKFAYNIGDYVDQHYGNRFSVARQNCHYLWNTGLRNHNKMYIYAFNKRKHQMMIDKYEYKNTKYDEDGNLNVNYKPMEEVDSSNNDSNVNNQNKKTVKFSWLTFIALMFLFFPLAVIYLIGYLLIVFFKKINWK